MKKTEVHKTVVAIIGILMLILDSKTALRGASEGLSLCIETVIPSLFPMLLISVYLNDRLKSFNMRILSPLAKPLGIPSGFEGILFIGFSGGYPVGAQGISQAYTRNDIDKQTAEHLLAFCNNAGPAFIFGITSSLFSRQIYVWLLWFIHIASAYITGLILTNKRAIEPVKSQYTQPLTVIQALQIAIRVLSSICAWIIVFRVLIRFCDRWFLWLFPEWLQCIYTGMLELTNGCLQLLNIESEIYRFILCSVLLGFGGLCVFMQTISVISPLKPTKYILGKITQSSISLLLSVIVFILMQPAESIYIPLNFIFIPIILIAIIVIKQKKTVAKCKKMLYTIPNRQK